MGQQAQNGGRRASLDDKKRRAAGRQKQNSPERRAIKDAVGITHGSATSVGGAHGRDGQTKRRGGVGRQGAGGGGGEPTEANSAPMNVGASSKRARRRA